MMTIIQIGLLVGLWWWIYDMITDDDDNWPDGMA